MMGITASARRTIGLDMVDMITVRYITIDQFIHFPMSEVLNALEIVIAVAIPIGYRPFPAFTVRQFHVE